MNRKIKAFATQARLQPYYDTQSAAIQIFAELIINDCCGTAREYVDTVCEYDNPDGIVQQIKDGFGVK